MLATCSLGKDCSLCQFRPVFHLWVPNDSMQTIKFQAKCRKGEKNMKPQKRSQPVPMPGAKLMGFPMSPSWSSCYPWCSTPFPCSYYLNPPSFRFQGLLTLAGVIPKSLAAHPSLTDLPGAMSLTPYQRLLPLSTCSFCSLPISPLPIRAKTSCTKLKLPSTDTLVIPPASLGHSDTCLGVITKSSSHTQQLMRPHQVFFHNL